MVKLATAILLATASLAFASDPPSQPALAWSVTIGGSGAETVSSVAVDDAGYIYVAGSTSSIDFPVTPGAAQTVLRGTSDAFVVKLTPDGKTTVYATYLGGTGTEAVTGLGVDGAGNAYLGVRSTSDDYPGGPSSCSSSACSYITKLSADGRSVNYSRRVAPKPSGQTVFYGVGRVVAGEDGTVYFGSTSVIFNMCVEYDLSVLSSDGATDRLIIQRGNCEQNQGLQAFAQDRTAGLLAAYTDLSGLYAQRIGIGTTAVTEWKALGSGTVEAVTSDDAGGAYVLGSKLLHVNRDGEIDSSVPMQLPQGWWTTSLPGSQPFRHDTRGALHAVFCGSACRAATIDSTGAVLSSAIIAGATDSWAYGYGPLGQLVAAGNSGGDVSVHLYVDAVMKDFSGPVTARFNTGVTWTAESIRPGAEYKFIRQDPDAAWHVVRDWSSVPTYTWFPAYGDLGVHELQVWVRTPGSTALYEDWRGTEVTVTDAPLPAIADLTATVSSYHIGETLTWTAHATGGFGVPQFAFLRLDGDGWHLARPYSSDNSYTWIPAASDLGPHTLQVWVRNGDSGAAYEDWTSATFIVDAPVPLAVQLVALDPIAVADTRAIAWRAMTTGGAGPLQFQFWQMKVGGTWSLVQDYGAQDTYSWRPGVNDAGTYALQVWVRNAGSTAAYDAWAGTGLFSVPPPFDLALTFTSQPAVPLAAGVPAYWSAAISTSTSTAVLYQFVRLDADGWHVVQPYGFGSSVYSWTPLAADVGQHGLQVWAKRMGSLALYESWAAVENFDVVPSGDVVLNGSRVAYAGVRTGWTATTTAISSIGLGYTFYRLDVDGWHAVQDGTSSSYLWTPTNADAGEHTLQVWIHTPGSTALYDAWAAAPFTVATLPSPVVQIEQLGSVPEAGTPYQFKFVRLDADGWHVVQDYSVSDTYVWNPGPTDTGSHLIQVWVRNAGSTSQYDGWATTGTFIVPNGP